MNMMDAFKRAAQTIDKRENFKKELSQLINKYSYDQEFNTPDFILAEFLDNALLAFDVSVKHRDQLHEKNT